MTGVLAAVAAGGRPDLKAVAAPTSLLGFKTGSGTVITSSPSVCTASGGVAPYTYAWTAISNPDSISIVTSAINQTYFRKTMGALELVTGTFKCVVTDDLGTIVDSNTVTVELFTV